MQVDEEPGDQTVGVPAIPGSSSGARGVCSEGLCIKKKTVRVEYLKNYSFVSSIKKRDEEEILILVTSVSVGLVEGPL